jgi:predicted transcriptional regulator
MKVSEVMNSQPIRIGLDATIKEATELLHNTQASDLMVVTHEGDFIGVLSEGDLIRKALPQMDEIIAQGAGLAGGIELFVEKGKGLAEQPVESFVIKGALSVAPDAAVLKAAGIMISKQIRRLPVVADGKLVGTIARADICLGLMR